MFYLPYSFIGFTYLIDSRGYSSSNITPCNLNINLSQSCQKLTSNSDTPADNMEA